MTLYYYILKKPVEGLGCFMAEFAPPITIWDLNKIDEIKSSMIESLESRHKTYKAVTEVDENGWEITRIEVKMEGH